MFQRGQIIICINDEPHFNFKETRLKIGNKYKIKNMIDYHKNFMDSKSTGELQLENVPYSWKISRFKPVEHRQLEDWL